MRLLALPHGAILPALLAILSCPLAAQDSARGVAQTPKPPKAVDRIFTDSTPLPLKLVANFGALRRDRSEDPKWRAGEVVWVSPRGDTLSVPVRVRPRGIWRRKNCAMPPMRLDFAAATAKGTIFEGLDRPKLVNTCQPTFIAEQNLLQEFQLYRIYNLVTPLSFKARLLRLTYVDSAGLKKQGERWAILIEEPKSLADRSGMKVFTTPGVSSGELDPDQQAIFAVFQYFIGNTDFSVAALHNVEVLQQGEAFYPVAYDFDYAGAVDAKYALPDPRLPIKKVTERLFRGYCVDPELFERAFAIFRAKKAQIYALYDDEIGKLLPPGVVRTTRYFFDDFYYVIEDQRRARDAILTRCAK